MKYPEKFCTAELIKFNSDELQHLTDLLWADWERVNNALKVVRAMEDEDRR